MPKKGYKCITVKANVYDHYYGHWTNHKEEYSIKKGITSFSAFITYVLAKTMDGKDDQIV